MPAEDPPPDDDALNANDGAEATTSALEAVLPDVYRELRSIAARALDRGGRITLQPTDLVHEAYLRLSDQQHGWSDRPHLVLAASVAMRRALVDHVRRRRSLKRGEGVRASEDAEWVTVFDRRYDVLDLEDALTELERIDPLAAETASMRLFGGLGVAECAEGLAVSTRTIERRWRFARSWLVAELAEDAR
ncbi:MAG: ECF-type sigma factor [Planctomycetota bacterium]